ncbi:MAG: ribonuclease HII [archaeon]|nr:ribonuclease HII [archaeon]
MEDKNTLLLGVDDAGRGPVIGPMVLAGCLIEKEKESEFKTAGAKDSKLLTPNQREKILEDLRKIAKDYKYRVITPVEIDTGYGEGLNLNQVEALASASIINEITENLSKVQKDNLKIILDCPSINPAGWKNQLMSYIKDKTLEPKILCEHKADFNHVVVSAASILAKVTRDAEIEKLKEQIGINFGSGYPADPNTKAFLEEHVLDFKKERIFRESWATWQTAKNKKLGIKEVKSKQSKLFE